MRLPLWIGGPIVIGLAAADAAIELQARAIGALTRAMFKAMADDVTVDLTLLPIDHAPVERQSTEASR
ncbi:hypothetical protein [Rhodococcus triatomae]|nr:hypothetical protein G419_04910 [Rhodococcus triatomae BKS 15-14]